MLIKIRVQNQQDCANDQCTDRKRRIGFEHAAVDFQAFRIVFTVFITQSNNDHTDDTYEENDTHPVDERHFPNTVFIHRGKTDAVQG